MNLASRLFGSTSRRGLLVGAAGAGAALALRDRPTSVEPRVVPADRRFPVPELLISPHDLATRLAGTNPPQLLDASALADFRGDRIPAARHVWWQDTMELDAPYYGMVLKPDDGLSDQTRRQQLLERWQIRTGSPIVVYDRNDGSRAARVAWFLRFLSTPALVLDGGLAGWLALDRSIRDVPANVPVGQIATVQPREGFYLFASEIAARLGQPGYQMVDVRTEAERHDDPMAGSTAPDAIWLPRNALVDETGLLMPADQLSALFVTNGIESASQLFLIGPTALECAMPWLAASLTGAAQITIVDGGWTEWADVPGLPSAPL